MDSYCIPRRLDRIIDTQVKNLISFDIASTLEVVFAEM